MIHANKLVSKYYNQEQFWRQIYSDNNELISVNVEGTAKTSIICLTKILNYQNLNQANYTVVLQISHYIELHAFALNIILKFYRVICSMEGQLDRAEPELAHDVDSSTFIIAKSVDPCSSQPVANSTTDCWYLY